jgi:hypothetical protein
MAAVKVSQAEHSRQVGVVSASGSSGPAGLCPTRGADSGSLLLAAGVLTINKWGGGGVGRAGACVCVWDRPVVYQLLSI